MKKYFLVLIVLLISFFNFIGESSVYVKADSNSISIRSYGDSIAYGYGLADLSGAYPSLFAENYKKAFDIDFSAHAVSGDTTENLLDILKPYKNKTASDQLAFDNTDIIVLCIGANNVLKPAINAISQFANDEMTEGELEDLLSLGVEQFKLDFPEILEIFSGKQVVVMTVYNPYKYLTLNDVTIEASSLIYETLIQSRLSNYNKKLQKLIDISISNLKEINDVIRNTTNDDVTIVDVYNQFNMFNKSEYLQYINADVSKAVITQEDTSNIDVIIEKITENCDPHPSALGHVKIAEECLKTFNIFSAKYIINKKDVNINIDSRYGGEFNYKLYRKNRDYSTTLIGESKSNSISIEKSKLKNASCFFIEVYANNELIETTQPIEIKIEDKIGVSNILSILIYVAIGIVAILAIIYIILKIKHRKIEC